MMGTQDKQQPLFRVVNLDQRVRADHPLRRVKELIDFSFVRREVAPRYGYNGNASVDPEVILKMMFLLFFDDISSERELMKVIAERLDYLWFLDYSLDDAIPDHSVLSKARARWGPEVFEKLFVRRGSWTSRRPTRTQRSRSRPRTTRSNRPPLRRLSVSMTPWSVRLIRIRPLCERANKSPGHATSTIGPWTIRRAW